MRISDKIGDVMLWPMNKILFNKKIPKVLRFVLLLPIGIIFLPWIFICGVALIPFFLWDALDD